MSKIKHGKAAITRRRNQLLAQKDRDAAEKLVK
jgi:hypothetical protein